MNILLTGAAGFIGHAVYKRLLDQKTTGTIVGVDSINAYYSPALKLDRLSDLGFRSDDHLGVWRHKAADNAEFIKLDLTDRKAVEKLFAERRFDLVCHLAAQAGVRYSIENPRAYIDSNITAFLNILEASVRSKTTKLVYASSSSVYGANQKMPFSVADTVDNPVSLYAATKKSNELMAHVYSNMYGIQTLGLRFFTVYGPWGRPDMAPMLFSDAISKGSEIRVFNEGRMMRDFTYISDIVEGVLRVMQNPLVKKSEVPYRVYNIGRGEPVKILDFITCLEENLGNTAEKVYLPMQPGDVEATWADIADLTEDYGYSPQVSIQEGVQKFADWYKNYRKGAKSV